MHCAQSCCLLIELIAFWTFSLPSSLAVGEALATTTATAMRTSKKAITSGFSVCTFICCHDYDVKIPYFTFYGGR